MLPVGAIPVYWWSNRAEITPEVQWDSGDLHRLFHNDLWITGFEFVYEHGDSAPRQNVPSVVVVAARHHVGDVAEINGFISHLPGVVLILLGDEEAVFPWRDIIHPNIRFWVMMPHPARHADMAPWAYFFGTGCKCDTGDIIDDATDGQTPEKDLLWAFAGQATHPRRKQAVDGLSRASHRVAGTLMPTQAFTAGMPRFDYLSLLARTKIAPAPSGPQTADSMRLYEALEAGCLPIVDTGPEGAPAGFWEMLYGNDHPLIVTNDWGGVGGIIEAETSTQRWPRNANMIGSWWRQQKRGMAQRMRRDLIEVGAAAPALTPRQKVTIVVTTSPVPSNPSIDMISDTILSTGLIPDSDVQVIIACDGVRPEQVGMRPAYDEFVRELVWLSHHSWENTLVLVSKEHRHQAGMLKMALEHVDTPVIAFLEHDAPFSREPNETIEWDDCINLVDYGAVDILRFHHEAQVLAAHRSTMLDHRTETMLGVPLRRTVQYSARPHLARTDYYREVLERHFPPTSNCFVEDKLHGIVQTDRTMRHAVAIYHPEGSIRRTLHADGRAGGPKYDAQQRFV